MIGLLAGVLAAAASIGIGVAAGAGAAAGQQPDAVVTVRVDQVVRTAPRTWLGHNLEWVWQGQGLFHPDGSGAKPGVAELIAALNPGLLRYPGGSLANTFRWRRSIGALDARAAITNFFENTPEVPLLGFDDFMRFCHEAKAHGAMITVNCTSWPDRPGDSGSAQEAAAWVAYANARLGDAAVDIGKDYRGEDWLDSQHWARLRAANGHPEPWDVRHWEIGNEVYDPKQGARMTPGEYAERAMAFAQAMKAVDPRIAVGIIHWPQGEWNTVPALVQDGAPGLLDFRVLHDYAQSGRQLFNYHTGLRDTGERTYRFTTARAGLHTIVIRAWGRPLATIPPRMEVRLDATPLGAVDVTASAEATPSEHAWTVELAAGEHALSVQLLNAEPVQGRPYRDLYLKTITVTPPAGDPLPLDLNTPELLMLKAASTVEKLMPPSRGGAVPTPGRLPYHRTEFAGMVGGEWALCRDQKSAVLAARLAHANLLDPDCAGANFWCIKSAAFLILERHTDGSYRYSPAGIVHRALAPLAGGEVLATEYEGPTFLGSWLYVDRPCGWLTAVATRKPHQIAVNLVNTHPSRDYRVALRLPGVRIQNRARTIALAGAGFDAMNEEGKPPVITMVEDMIEAAAETHLMLAPCSVKTVVFAIE